MVKLEPGAKVRYRSQSGQTREGTVKKAGRVWIEFESVNGAPSAWCKVDAVLQQKDQSSSTNGSNEGTDSEEPGNLSEETQSYNGSTATKLAPGTRCRYYKWDQHPEDPRWSVGVVTLWGRKYVEITREDDGAKDWGIPGSTFALAEGEEPPPVVDYGGHDSPFLTLSMGSIVAYRQHPAEGIRYGLFRGYDKYFHQVQVESITIPSWAKTPAIYKLREDLVAVEKYKLDYQLLTHTPTYRLDWRDTAEVGWEALVDLPVVEDVIAHWKKHKLQYPYGEYRVVKTEYTEKVLLEVLIETA